MTGTYKLGYVAVVDKQNGNDSTAAINGLPFLTVQGAILAVGAFRVLPGNATIPLTIWVLPGTYTLPEGGIIMPSYCCLRGLNTQTVILNCTPLVTNQVMLTMAANSRVEDVTLNMTCGSEFNLTGILFGGTTTTTAKLRTSVLTVDNSGLTTNKSTNVYAVNCAGSGSLNFKSFSYNCIKGSTINVLSNGQGNKRGILVSGSNVASIRDTNIYVAGPTDTLSTGSYVGVETNNIDDIGSIQLRTSSVGSVKEITPVKTYSSSDILQTTPATLPDPTYLASYGIQIGPGTDLITKSAGTKPFSLSNYPTTIYYGLIGVFHGSQTDGYMWPGSVVGSTTYPDTTTIPAFYRIQQPSILCGMSIRLNVLPPSGDPLTHYLRVIVRVTPVGSTIVTVPGYTSPDFINTSSSNTYNYYNSTFNLNTGDLIHVQLQYAGSTTGGGNPAPADLSIQLDIF